MEDDNAAKRFGDAPAGGARNVVKPIVSGFVTAGGKSSRMGQDKAWLNLGGRTMIGRAIETISAATVDVSLIANDDRYRTLGLPVLADINRGLGPIEALRVAVSSSARPRLVLMGCDLPFVTPRLLHFLIDQSSLVQAVVPVASDGVPQPLCAVYSRDILPFVEEMIASDQRKIGLLFDRIKTLKVPYHSIQNMPGADLFFQNINTPEEYEAALAQINSSEAK